MEPRIHHKNSHQPPQKHISSKKMKVKMPVVSVTLTGPCSFRAQSSGMPKLGPLTVYLCIREGRANGDIKQRPHGWLAVAAILEYSASRLAPFTFSFYITSRLQWRIQRRGLSIHFNWSFAHV
jgi:hypothetical protein